MGEDGADCADVGMCSCVVVVMLECKHITMDDEEQVCIEPCRYIAPRSVD